MIEIELDEIKKILENHETRLAALENDPEKTKKSTETAYSGLNGGINLLISEGFFGSLKPLAEVTEKLKEKGYHYGKGAVSKALANYFMKRDRLLTRAKEGKFWKYVVRK